ncbi:MAG TPA: GNAT family N-acetyltransferase [Chloroflexota bacterium]|nr:GNAT family N-acetyltransferase [Chloroflexota bacterium]
MYIHLGQVDLKTGEQMALGCVRCPDPSWSAQVLPLLGHKSRESREHFEQAFAGPLDQLDTRFYIGTIGGIAVTNVMIVGALRRWGGVAILGHVYTRPEHRQKGAYNALMAAQMEHIRQDGYRLITLSTGFETHPYWIYHRYGFRSIDGTSGKMKWLADERAEADYLAPGPTTVRPMRWDDWAPLEALAFQPVRPDEELPRSVLFGLKGQGGVEGPFQAVRRRIRRREAIQAVVLETAHGATVGWAALQPDPFAFGDARQLDLYVHAGFEPDAPKLLAALDLDAAARVRAYSAPPDGYRAASLREAGFTRTAELPDWLARGDERLPLRVYTRAG